MTPLPAIARALLEAIEEPALLIERHLLLAANQAARDLLGSGIEGKDVRLAVRHPEALELILGGAGAGTRELIGIGGSDRPWRLIVQPLPGNARLARLTDLSAARAAERMRVDFVANASHELRTPLATISGYAETLADDEPIDEGTRRRFGATIRTEAARMLRLIEELMGLSRIEADRFRRPEGSVDPTEIAELAIDETSELARQCGAAVELAAEPGLPAVRGDRAQLVQLATNLVSNALRYGCDKGRGSVRVTLARDGAAVRLSVRDSGDGIAPEHLPRLTERFYRVDAARSRDSGGTGLGLAIVKHIVERHRGTFDIRSAVGVGTEVAVTLPLA